MYMWATNLQSGWISSIFDSWRSCHIFFKNHPNSYIMPPSTYTNVYKHFKLDASSANVGMPNQLGFKINLDKNKQENLGWTVAIKKIKIKPWC